MYDFKLHLIHASATRRVSNSSDFRLSNIVNIGPLNTTPGSCASSVNRQRVPKASKARTRMDGVGEERREAIMLSRREDEGVRAETDQRRETDSRWKGAREGPR
jgi:hypothetical protein